MAALALAASSAAALELAPAGWIAENSDTFRGGKTGTGVWGYRNGQATAADNAIQFASPGARGEFTTFAADSASRKNQVEVESDLVLGGWSDALPRLPADAQCSIAWLRDGLRIYSADGWLPVSGAELLGDGRGRHRLLTRLDYTAKTFSMKIDGVLLRTRNGQGAFRLAGSPSAAQGCGFAGGGAIYSLSGGERTSSPATLSTEEVHNAFADLPAHPRLHVRGPAGLAALRADPSPRATLLRNRVVSAAKEKLSQALTTLGKDAANKRLTGDTTASSVIILCAAAYRFSDDVRFAARARDEMLSVCAQGANNGWVPSHYLGVAEVLRGLAFGYDWLYDALTPDERTTIRNAIITYGYGGMSGWKGWDTNVNNWSQVCWQGVSAAALAIYEDDPLRSETLLARCVKGLLPSLAVFAPHGSYPEGPGYWNYGTRLFCLLLDQFETSLGTTFGLYELPGISETGGYPVIMRGPSGKVFNYSDGGESLSSFLTSEIYLARKALRPDWARSEASTLDADLRGTSSILGENALWTLLWGDQLDATVPNQTPLEWFGAGTNPVAVLRESNQPHAMYLGIKGGSPASSHGHMDVGSFVFDMDGPRWASDLGSQNYASLEVLGTSVINLWNFTQSSTRWNVFRLNALSHNLVTINGAPQQVAANVPIRSTQSGEVSAAELDLSSIYGTSVCTSARRTFTMDRPNRRLRIGDTFAGLAAGVELRWALTTKATVRSITGDVIHLFLNGSCLDIAMNASVPGTWSVEDISTGPNSWDCTNTGYRQIVYTTVAPSTRAVTLEATLSPPAVDWPAGTTFYGLDQGISSMGEPVAYGSLLECIGWWTGPTTSSSQEDTVPPWRGAAHGFRYVILSATKTKLTQSGSFPDLPIQFGTETLPTSIRANGNIRLTVPDGTVYGGTFSGNSSGIFVLDGRYRFVKSRNVLTMTAGAVENAPRGVSLAGQIIADADVVLHFGATFSTGYHSAATHRIAGDATQFKGSYRVDKPSYKTGNTPEDQYILIALTSPSALGDSSAPRTDALVLMDNTALTMGPDVIQDGTRGITCEIGPAECIRLQANATEDWTLAAPVLATKGTLRKTGEGTVTLARNYTLPALVVEDGHLGLASNVCATVSTFTGEGRARPAGVYGSAEACAIHRGVQRDDALTGPGILRVLNGPPAPSVILFR